LLAELSDCRKSFGGTGAASISGYEMKKYIKIRHPTIHYLNQSQIYFMFHRPGSLEMEMLAHSPSVQYDHTKLFSS